MRRQSIKILVGMIVLSFLLGCCVLLFAYFSPHFNYSIQSNIESNSDYYRDLTADLVTERDESK